MLEYDLTDEDFVAWNVFASTNLPAMVKQERILRIGASVILMALMLSMVGLEGYPFVNIAVGLVFVAVVWLVSLRLRPVLIRGIARRFAKSGGLGITGHYRVWLEDDGLHEASPTSTSIAAWPGIKRIEENDDYLFILTGPMQSCVIPKRMGAETVRAFGDEVRARLTPEAGQR